MAPLFDTIMIWLFALLIDDVLMVCNFSAVPPPAITDVVIRVVIGGWWTSPGDYLARMDRGEFFASTANPSVHHRSSSPPTSTPPPARLPLFPRILQDVSQDSHHGFPRFSKTPGGS
jgi:hypothetical protein